MPIPWKKKSPPGTLSLLIRTSQSSLDLNKQQTSLGQPDQQHTPKSYLHKRSIHSWVSIDGEPKLQTNKDWGVEAVVNTTLLLVKNRDDKFYLYGGKHWYIAPSATGPYKLITDIPEQPR